MIVGNIHYKASYAQLDEKLRKCLEYAHTHNLSEYEEGSYPIDGENLFVNIGCYDTTAAENRIWEAHRKYIDLHLMLDGQERMDVNFLDNMELKAYSEKDDFLPAAGERKSSVVLEIGDYLVCYPEDVHMVGIQTAAPERVKKAVFKIKV